MKKLVGNRLRACLSMLLIVVFFLTSFLFGNITSNAQDGEVGSFYVLDDEGNPIKIEIPQESTVSKLRSRVAAILSSEDEGISAHSDEIGVLRFVHSDSKKTIDYTEVDTGRAGYFYGYSAADAAYIRTEGDYYICKLSGVVMKVHKSHVNLFVEYSTSAKISHYWVADNGYLMHDYTYYSGNAESSLSMMSTRVGYKPSYLEKGTKYYSYDGHYFYTDFTKMIQDYRSNTYANAVNVQTPYYNYYQYLSFHTTAPFAAGQYDSYIAQQNKPNSKLLTTGSAFVATQSQYTVNALLLYGIAINESAWGTSNIALTKNNLFGWNAVDSSPGETANYFKSVEQCIREFAYQIIHIGYLDGMDWRYRGPHVGNKRSGMNVKYASDPYWGEKAAARGYYFDTEKLDYGRYSIGIARSGMIAFYKEADTASTCIYTSDARDGTYIYDFPVTILEQVTGKNGKKFYKVVSDMSLTNDRAKKDLEAIYNPSRDYVYVEESDVQVVFQGNGNITLPNQPTQPDGDSQGKTHAQVLSALNLVNTDKCLTGFTVGGEVATIISKVKALDSTVGIVVKNTQWAQVASGIFATGMKIAITTNGSTVEYSVAIRGDVSGDGKLSAVDYVKLRNYLDGATTLKGAHLKSTDVNRDGKTSAVDYVKLRNYLDHKSSIVQ